MTNRNGSSSVNASKSLGPWAINKVHNVDCEMALRQMPDDCLDIAVTSPPYWGQRGSAGLGSEPDPRDYVANLVRILAEVMRCLKPSGTLWLNIGDSYNTPINWRTDDYSYSTLGPDRNGLAAHNSAYTKNRGQRRAFIDEEAKWLRYGNLLAVPWRVVIGLCELGFLFRGEVIWSKLRPLPEGRCRRPHRKHEGIYIIAKSEQHSFRTAPPVGSIWQLLQTPNKTAHCSTFPLDLPIQCIEAAEVERGIVLDPFMGSGTTGRAALSKGLDFIGFELDKRNCAIAADCIYNVERPLFT
ncbi:MAG TPA: site-specific DNA-methyltransferase [Pirellulales bacterium]|nr:site-specific DNA-methyltransferase [Pirellulales bacterium]